MAARLTDKQKKKIIADYVELGSYNAVAKIHGVSRQTVKNVVTSNPESGQKLQQKKEQNTKDIFEYLESQKSTVCAIIGLGLDVLNDREKLESANPAQITTALGTLIDKFTAPRSGDSSQVESDGLIEALESNVEQIFDDGDDSDMLPEEEPEEEE